MTIPTSLARAADRALQAVSHDVTDPASLRGRVKPQLRRYNVSALLPNGSIADTRHLAPALPVFEDAFCAFSRGALVETEEGPVAVEDLIPGDMIVTISGEAQKLLWKGSTTIVPGRPSAQGRDMRLTRIMADALGLQRPLACVIAGPSARLLHTPDHLRGISDGLQTLTSVKEFIDGESIIDTAPPTPVEVFHICLAKHSVIRIGGLEFETYHPGEATGRVMNHALRTVFLNLFAHVETFREFGPVAFPRIGETTLDAMSA
jgi:hypothetical protein